MLLVLWDIDGTLVDTAGYGRHAFADAFEEVVGRTADMDVPFAGFTDHQIALALLERNGVEGDAHVPRVLEALARRQDLIRADGRALPGVREALEALGGRDDVVQSLLTGNVRANAVAKLAAFGLEGYLDFEVGGFGSDPHERRSDLVAVARERTARKYGVDIGVEDTVLIGDTARDVAAAREAGARAVGVVEGGFGDPEELRASAPDALLPDLRDTGALLEALSPR